MPSSLGSTVAKVVLPRPGGPSKRMCASGSLSFWQALRTMPSRCTTAFWPMTSRSQRGRRAASRSPVFLGLVAAGRRLHGPWMTSASWTDEGACPTDASLMLLARLVDLPAASPRRVLNVLPPASTLSSRLRASDRTVADAHQRLVRIFQHVAVDDHGRGRRLAGLAVLARAARPSGRTCVTLRRSVAMICSAVAAPTPGRVVSHLASCRWMASAISLIGRTSALSALRMPTLSTVQNSSKNSSSASVRKPIKPRHDPALHRVAVEVMAGVQRHFLARRASALAADELRHQHLVLERPDLQPHLLVQDAVEHAGDPGDHARFSSCRRARWA